MLFEQFDEPIVAELFIFRIAGFGDSVGVAREDVARI